MAAETLKKTTMDDIVNKLGLWHAPLLIAYLCRDFFFAIAILYPSFAAPNMDYWCAKPEQFANWSTEDWKNTAIPLETRDDKLVHSRCYMQAYDGDNQTGFHFLNRTLPCKRWEYDTSFYTLTLINQWDLVCDSSWLVSFSQSLFLGGMMIGGIIFSHIADRYGRKRSLFFSIMLSVAASFLTAISPTFAVFNVMRVLLSIGSAGLQGAFLSLLLECVTQRKRYVIVIGGFGYVCGCVTLAWTSYFVTNWKMLQLILCASPVACAITWIFLPESPRWLLATGRVKQAETCLMKIAKQNNVKDICVQDVISSYSQRQDTESTKNSRKSYLDLFRHGRIRKLSFFIFIMYIVHRMITFHLTFFSARLGSSPFVSFTIVACFNIVGEIISIFLVRCFRRRLALIGTFAVTAVFILLLIPFTEDYIVPRTAATVIAKMANGAAVNVLNAFSAELFPTVVRSMGLGLAYTMSRLGAVISPFFKELEDVAGNTVAACTAAAITMLGAVAAIFLPETLNKPLPENLEDIENIFYKKAKEEREEEHTKI